MDITKVIARNLSAWMEANPALDTLIKLSKASHVGFGTVRRARNGDGNITVQNLEAIAQAFKRQAIDLLAVHDAQYHVATPPSIFLIKEPPADETELLRGFRDASPEVKDSMLAIARMATQKQDFSERSETQ